MNKPNSAGKVDTSKKQEGIINISCRKKKSSIKKMKKVIDRQALCINK